MSRNKPDKRRKKAPKNQHPLKSRYELRFLFESSGSRRVGADYCTELTSRIKPENLSRGGVIHRKEEEPVELPEKNGYLMLMDQRFLGQLFNPNEFYQLDLSSDSRKLLFYDLFFQGRSEREHAGILIPDGCLPYLTGISGVTGTMDPDGVARILEKQGFRKETIQVHQNPPPSDRPPPSPVSRIVSRARIAMTWNTLLPLKEVKIPGIRDLFFIRESPLFRLAFLLSTLAVFILLPILSLDAGLSGDDEKHYEHAKKVYRYYSEDDPSALDDPRLKLNYYGQSFDFFTYLVIRWFHLEEHPYETRHVLVALTGAGAILCTGLLVKLFAGYSGAWLAIMLMFLSPRFLGHSFNNPMDIPFALGNIFTIYHLILFLRKLPRISTRSALMIALGIAWTNGIRIGGLLLIPYLFMFSGLYLLIHPWPWRFFSAHWWRFAGKGLLTLVLISASGYLLSLLTWPYALEDIINHPIQAFKVMTDIQVSIRVLYDGLINWSDKLPWHYIPQHILYTVPALVLAGCILSLAAWYLERKRETAYWYFMLWFTVLFPVIFIIIRESNVYGGWRHMMFIYPSLLALAAAGITCLIRRVGHTWLRRGLVILLVAGMMHPLRHIAVNHPHTYVYFNELLGGVKNAYGRFETDYYANSLGPASGQFIGEILPAADTIPGDPVTVVSNSDISYYFRNQQDRVSTFYSRYYDRGKNDWDYAILYCNYIHPYQLNNGYWPPKNTIRELKVDDVVVAAIVKRENRDDYLGASLLQEGIREEDPGKLQRAVNHLEQAVEYDPENVAALMELGNAYTAFLRFGEARSTLDRLLEFYPEYDKALNLKGYTYLIESEVSGDPQLIDEAIRLINKAISSNMKFYSGYYNLGLCYTLKNDTDNAIHNYRQAIRYNGRFIPAYEKLAELYEFTGDMEMARTVRARLNSIRP